MLFHLKVDLGMVGCLLKIAGVLIMSVSLKIHCLPQETCGSRAY